MEKKKNTKKIIGTVVDVLIWVLVVLCVGVSIVAVSAGTNAKNVPTVGSTCFLNVKTESMDAEKPAGVPADKPAGFSAGTMLLSKYIAEDDAAIDALEVGDIITFEMKPDGSDTVDYNTHRIVAVERNENGTLVSVTTKGDNNDLADGGQVSRGTIIAVYTGSKIPALGKVLDFLSTQVGFGVCILLPLILFFIYQLVKFVMAFMSVKNSGKKVISAADEELIRQRAVEEYLKKQQEKENNNEEIKS